MRAYTASGPAEVAGLVLAGGLGRRMGGGDKALKILMGRPLIEHVLARAAPQVGALAINSNGDPAVFAEAGLPVVPDAVEGFAGPLAGVLTGLEWAAEAYPAARWVASFACDAPFFPGDLVARLLSAVESQGSDLACATSGGRSHPVFGLWPLSLREELRRAVVEEEIRKVDRWTARHRLVEVDFPLTAAAPGGDPFFNANRPDDLAAAEARSQGAS